MEDTASHETAYKLAHRADKANPWSDYCPTLGRITIQLLVELLSNFSSFCFTRGESQIPSQEFLNLDKASIYSQALSKCILEGVLKIASIMKYYGIHRKQRLETNISFCGQVGVLENCVSCLAYWARGLAWAGN
jgi:hypothetical protein